MRSLYQLLVSEDEESPTTFGVIPFFTSISLASKLLWTSHNTSLPCETIVFRVLSQRPVEADGTLKAKNFLLKKNEYDGLSIFASDHGGRNCSNTLKGMDGLASMHVGQVRRAGKTSGYAEILDVIAKASEDPRLYDHGLILNLPNRHDGDAQAMWAEKLARELAKISRGPT